MNKKIYFQDLTGAVRVSGAVVVAGPNDKFIAERINWCEDHIGSRHKTNNRDDWGWDTIPVPNDRFYLIAPMPIGIEFFKEEYATAFLLVFK